MSASRHWLGLFVIAILSAAALASTAAAATITEFPLGEEHRPWLMKAGPDGNLWFTDRGSEGGIGRISPSGEIFPETGHTTTANDLAFAPDGTLYWANDDGLGRRATSGFVTEITGEPEAYATTVSSTGLLFWNKVTSASFACSGEPFGGSTGCSGWAESGKYTGFAFDGAGELWAVAPKSNAIRKVFGVHNGALIELPPKSEPERIALGPDGNLWVTDFGAGAIDRVTTSGQRQRFPLPAGSKPDEIVAGPDGAMWFTEFGSGKIGRITTAGVVTEYPIPTPEAEPIGLAFGPEGNLFFTEGVGKIGRLVPDPPVIPGGGNGGGAGGAAGGSAASAADSTDHMPPSFTAKPSFLPARFAVAGAAKASAGRKKAAGGSKLGVSLSEAATVTATVSRSLPGRRKGGRCVAPAGAAKGAARCKRLVGVGTQSWSVVAGASKLPFSGKLGGKTLKPGAYSASLVARDAAGSASAPTIATFTIVAR